MNTKNQEVDSDFALAHSGPIKSPKQLLAAVFFSFVVPIFAIIGLVYYVVSGNQPDAGSLNSQAAVAKRIAKVGVVEIRDANRELKSGEDVYKAQCINCHGAGLAGAPKFGDVAAWSARIRQGFDALLHSALKGKGAMSPQGGGDFEDLEIARAVVYITSAAGAKFVAPTAPVAPTGPGVSATTSAGTK